MIDPPDLFHLRAAEGWLELGNGAEAKTELAYISANLLNHPDVLQVRWEIHANDQDWTAALEVARALVQSHPERFIGWVHQAYALRRVPGGGLDAAREALLPALDGFPNEPIIPYNLACYACQLGMMDEARQLLREAVQRGDHQQMKAMALRDEDLKPLWEEIRSL
ncbi:MAG: tetratricopeptide repeat protein [Verrucomicrobiota bacterium]|jgi:Flp pilus assembly protein TadD